MTQNLLAFFTKCKQTFRVINDTSELTNCHKKEDEEAIVIQDCGSLIFDWRKKLCNHDNS